MNPLAARHAFSHVAGEWAKARLPAAAALPAWALGGNSPFTSITRTERELSIVMASSAVPVDVPAERNWALLMLHGPFAFTVTGVIASFTQPLAVAEIGVFVISTFDTDYLLLSGNRLVDACTTLTAAGHSQR